MKLIISPNTVVANSLINIIDIFTPKMLSLKPSKIVFVVGTQINGAPHLGTNIVQTLAFLLANEVRHRFSVDTSVKFSALDNAPYDIILDPLSFRPYQITYFHSHGEDGINNLINQYYKNFFDKLSDYTNIEYEIETYSKQQGTKSYREKFVSSLSQLDTIRWLISPSSGVAHIRIPCSRCHFAEKYSEKTFLIKLANNSAIFECYCFEHGKYEEIVSLDSTNYLDLNTIYRNVIKESASVYDGETLNVMVKGGDWVFGCHLVDWTLAAMGYSLNNLPMRIFAPQIIVETGAKLSKSLIKKGDIKLTEDNSEWILDTLNKQNEDENYVENLIKLVDVFMSDPKHFFRSYSYIEIKRIMSMQKKDFNNKGRPLRIFRKYFQLIKSGEKTIEVRVAYSSMKSISAGQYLRFICHDDSCLTKVIKVSQYNSFDELFKNEDYKKINPQLSIPEQLTEIRKIFPKEKENLGVLAIEVEKA